MHDVTVLIVDDSPADQLLVEVALKKANKDINILKAFDGKEALDILKEYKDTPPDLILLDLNMPGMGGLDFLRHYQRWGNKTIVAILTSSILDQDKKESLSYDFVSVFITKPLNNQSLNEIEVLLK